MDLSSSVVMCSPTIFREMILSLEYFCDGCIFQEVPVNAVVWNARYSNELCIYLFSNNAIIIK